MAGDSRKYKIYTSVVLDTKGLTKQLKDVSKSPSIKISLNAVLNTKEIKTQLSALSKDPRMKVSVGVSLDKKGLNGQLKVLSEDLRAQVALGTTLDKKEIKGQLKALSADPQTKITLNAAIDRRNLLAQLKALSKDPRVKVSVGIDLRPKDVTTQLKVISKKADTKITAGVVLDGKGVGTQLKSLSKNTKIKIDASSVDTARKKVSALGQSWDSVLSKFLQWQIAGSLIHAPLRAITTMVDGVYELDKALIEFDKVADLSKEGMDSFTNSAFKAGEALAKTGTQVVEASTEFVKSGYKERALELAEISLLFTNIADSEVSAGAAATFLISQMKAFGVAVGDEMQIVDQLNEVSNNFSVSSSDLATAIPKVAATMALAGNSMSQTLGLLTAGVEMMPANGGRVARGLRSVTLNIQGVTDEGEKNIELQQKMQNEFAKLGISLKETDGGLKSTFNVLKEYTELQASDEFDELARSVGSTAANLRNYYAELMGGKTQVDVVNSIVSNFSSAIDANAMALNSAGSAMKENEKYMQGMEAKVNSLKSAFIDFSRKSLESDLLKGLIDIGTILTKLIGSDIGVFTLQVAGLTMAFGLFNNLIIGKMIPSLVSFGGQAGKLIKSIINMKLSAMGLSPVFNGVTGSLTALQTSLLSIAPWVAITTAIVGVIKLFDYLNVTLEEQAEIVSGLTAEYKGIENELKSIEEQISANIDKLKELNANPLKSLVDTDDITNLQSVNRELEARGNLLAREAEIKARELSEAVKKQYKKDFEKPAEKVSLNPAYPGIPTSHMLGTDGENLITEKAYTAELIDEISRLNEVKATTIELTEEEQIAFTGYREELNAIGLKYAELAQSPGLAVDDADRLSWVEMTKTIDAVLVKSAELVAANEEAGNSFQEVSFIGFEWAGELISLSDDMGILNGALEEINSTGEITPQTFDALIKEDLLKYFEVLDGKIVGVSDALKLETQTVKDAAVAQIQAALTSDILAIAQGTLAEETEEVGRVSTSILDPLTEAGFKYSEVGAKALAGAGDISAFNSALIGEGFDISAFTEEQMQKTEVAVTLAKQRIAAVDAITLSPASKKPRSREGKTTDPVKAEFDVFFKDLEYRRSKDVISEAQYYEELEKANQKYFANKKKYLDDFQKYDIKIYEYMKKRELEIEEEKRKGYTSVQKDIEHKEMLSFNASANVDKSVAYYRTLQENAHKEANRRREAGIEENDDYLEELQAQWWQYQKKITSLLEEEEEKRKKIRLEALEKEKELLEASLYVYERYAEGQVDIIQGKIDGLEAEKDALKKVNDERQSAIKLQELEDALAKAKSQNVRVYREGKGFVYEADQVAISEAQQNLQEYKREENLKHELAIIDEKIKAWEIEKKKWAEVVANYKKQQDLLIAEQLSGITLEKLNQDTRLQNLQAFVAEYNRINSQLVNVNTAIKDNDKNGGGGSSSGSSSNNNQSIRDEMQSNSDKWHTATDSEKKELEDKNQQLGGSIGGSYDPSSGKWEFAKGTNNFPGGSLVVGENVGEKGREIITPPRGSGIIPNPVTEKLMDFGANPKKYLTGLLRQNVAPREVAGNSIVENYNINGVTVQANDGQAFLSSIKALALQRTVKRG